MYYCISCANLRIISELETILIRKVLKKVSKCQSKVLSLGARKSPADSGGVCGAVYRKLSH